MPKPCKAKPKTHRSPPRPGENVVSDSGAYANQPKDAAPCGVRKPATTISEPNSVIQNANMFSRGNAMSTAPICSGTR